MSRCHYIYTEDGLKVFVPGCMGCAVHGPGKAYCTCGSRQYKSEESRRNKELKKQLNETEKELDQAYRTIRKLVKRKRNERN